MIATIRSLINRLGIDVVRTTTYNHDLGDHLRNVLAAQQIDAVLDVGANRGGYGELLRRCGFKGRIYSFEPVSSVFTKLEAAARGDDLWTCHNFALSDAAGEHAINVYEGDVFSSFLNVNDYSKDIWANLRRQTTETVRLARLDEVLGELPGLAGCSRLMIKLDTQGYDLRAFRGAGDVLDRVEALQSEITFLPLYDRMDDPYKVLAEYRDAGFYVSGVYPINRDPSLAIVEYDCVMVARRETAKLWETAPVAD